MAINRSSQLVKTFCIIVNNTDVHLVWRSIPSRSEHNEARLDSKGVFFHNKSYYFLFIFRRCGIYPICCIHCALAWQSIPLSTILIKGKHDSKIWWESKRAWKFSWYSWIINSLVNGVYAFGFLFMMPQLFLNYKLKSVAHLPWRAFMYKVR